MNTIAPSLPAPTPTTSTQSLRRWLVAGFAALNLLVMLLVGFTIQHSYEDHTERTLVEADNVSMVLQHNLAHSLTAVDNALLSLIDEYQSQQASGQVDSAALAAFISRARARLPAMAAMHITDADGVLRYGADAPVGTRLADSPEFIRLRDEAAAGLVISAPQLSAFTGTKVLYLARRIDVAGSFAGMAAAMLPIDHFPSQFQTIELGAKGVAALRDQQLSVIARYPANSNLGAAATQGGGPRRLQELVAQGRSSGTFQAISPIDQTERIVAFQQVGDFPFFVTVGLSVEDRLAAWHTESSWLIGLLVIFALLSALAARFIYLSWQRRLHDLHLLERQASLFHTVADLTYNWETWLAPDGKLLYCSPSCRRLTGYGAEEFVASPRLLVDIAHPDDRDAVGHHFFPAAPHAEDIPRLVFRIRHQDDQRQVWLECVTQKVFDDSGQLMGLRSSLRDITARKQAEDALQLKQDQLETIIDNLPAVFFAKDAQGRYLIVNHRFEEAAGLGRNEVTGKTDADVYPPAIAAAFRKSDLHILSADAAVTFEELVPHPDGSLRSYLTTKAPLKDKHDRTYALIGMATDITQLKQLQHELIQARDRAERASHAKTEFLTNMSHEIRTPMSGVIGMAELLQTTQLDEKQRRMLRVLVDSAHSQLRILNDILDFSNIEAGRLELAPEAFRLSSVLAKVCAVMGPQAQQRQVSLHHAIDASTPATLVGDPLRLRQILSNLVSNAIKFSDPARAPCTVDISARRDAAPTDRAWIRIEVRDNGIGMDESSRSALFSPFSQADSSSTRRHGGSGLGLAISLRLARAMGGDIDVESSPGAGSTFTVRLPFDLPGTGVAAAGEAGVEARPASAPVPTREEALRQNRLILVAEDNETNQEVIRQQLALLGFQSDIADDGRIALGMWMRDGYALVVSDIHMPHMDGYQLAQAIRAEEAKSDRPRTPMLALTANILSGEAERCKSAGMDDYLAKPASLPALKAAVERLAAAGSPAPAGEADAPELPLFDPDTLTKMLGDNPAIHRRLLLKFLTNLPTQSAQIIEHCTAGDADAAGKAAHTLKSAARTVGAMRLGALSEEIELAGKAKDLAACRLLVEQLSSLLPATQGRMESDSRLKS